MENKIITPIVHLNGTAKQVLIDNLIDIREALKTAIDLLAEHAPHGRDYYPEDGRYQKAKAQFMARLEKLTEVYQALGTEAELIDKGE